MSKPWYLSVLRNRAQLQSELPSQNPILCLAWIQAPGREDLSSYGHLGAEGRGVRCLESAEGLSPRLPYPEPSWLKPHRTSVGSVLYFHVTRECVTKNHLLLLDPFMSWQFEATEQDSFIRH